MFAARLPADLEQLPKLLDDVDRVAAALPESLRYRCQVVVEELFVNIALYAYDNKAGEVDIRLEGQGAAVLLTLIDGGRPFNPLGRELPDLTERFARGIPGGAGLHLVRSMARHAAYERKDGKNILRLVLEEQAQGETPRTP